MSNEVSNTKFSGLPRQLVSLGLLTEENAQQAVEASAEEKKDFLTVAVRDFELAPKRVAQMVGSEFGMPVFDLSALDPESLPREHLSLIHI